MKCIRTLIAVAGIVGLLSNAQSLAQTVFAGTPGQPNCRGQSVSALAGKYGGLDAGAAALGYPSVQALQTAIETFCQGTVTLELCASSIEGGSLSIVYNIITNTASEFIAICTTVGDTWFYSYTLNGVFHTGTPTCGAGPTIIPFSPPLAVSYPPTSHGGTGVAFSGLTSYGCGGGG